MCKRCGGDIWQDDPIFLWEGAWVCGGCNDELIRVDSAGASTDWVEAIHADVPRDQRDKLYKALVFAFHPDHGGDAHIMARINQEFGR